MSGYLFDASSLSAYLSEQHTYHASAVAKIDAIPADSLKLVSIMSLGELDYGVRLAEHNASKRLEEYKERLNIIRQYAKLDLTLAVF